MSEMENPAEKEGKIGFIDFQNSNVMEWLFLFDQWISSNWGWCGYETGANVTIPPMQCSSISFLNDHTFHHPISPLCSPNRKLRKQLTVPTQKQIARKPWRIINIPGFSSLPKPAAARPGASSGSGSVPSPGPPTQTHIQSMPFTAIVPPINVVKPPQPEPIVID